MEFKDYYKILGLESSASPEEVKKSYKRLARKYHPDVSKEADAEQKFKEVAEAYEVLKDQDKRREYDQLKAMGGADRGGRFTPPPGWQSGANFEAGDGHADFSDFFETLFGREGRMHGGFGAGQQAPRRGEDMQAELSLLLEEAWQGCEQILQVRVPEVDERGLLIYRNKKLKVKVPAGTTAGSVLRIKGQGAPGMGGAAAGDLLVRIQLAAHPLYTVEGKDVSLVAAILPWEAALGCKITVPSPGKRTRVSVPAGSQTGQKLRLGGLGLPGSPAGDFYVVLKVVMPETISDKAKELYRQLGEEAVPNPRAGWED